MESGEGTGMKTGKFISRIFTKTGALLIKVGSFFNSSHEEHELPVPLKINNDRGLYRLNEGQVMWLKNDTSCIDNCLLKTGTWEPQAVTILKKYLKPGSVFIDVGANIGFFSIIAARIIGEKGMVYAFEPTDYFYSVLQRNLNENKIDNCFTFKFGLSDSEKSEKIIFLDSSATMHVQADQVAESDEKIELKTFDSFVIEKKLSRIDFIKVDIDGHEPYFLNGALNSIEKFNPLILLEINHLSYRAAGVDVIDFYSKLKSMGFYMYDEFNLTEIKTLEQFLKSACNFNLSSNILLSKKDLNEDFARV
jgi:FkbM family methyltransferase